MYQVGTFPNWDVWGEWNGKFRDDFRCTPYNPALYPHHPLSCILSDVHAALELQMGSSSFGMAA